MAVLILGGTAEARALATALHDAGVAATTSLAGTTSDPRPVPGELRVGGFGGPAGLESWLVAHEVDAVVDATHPFAARISASAVTACGGAGVPLLRLERRRWKPVDGDRWHWVDSLHEAARTAAQIGTRVLLTTGRGDLGAFADVSEPWFLVRCITPPPPPLPPRHELMLERGPYTVEGELALIDRYAIDLVVSKESGGATGDAKLTAARRRGIPVVLVRRPPLPPATVVTTVEAAVRWLERLELRLTRPAL